MPATKQTETATIDAIINLLETAYKEGEFTHQVDIILEELDRRLGEDALEVLFFLLDERLGGEG